MRLLSVILTLLFAFPSGDAEELVKMDSLMCRLNAVLAACQNTDESDKNFGGLLCPRCGEYHSRSAEAVYPLALEGIRHSDALRIRQAVILGEWLLRRQSADGSWEESPRTGWTGTTADQLLALALAYGHIAPLLDDTERKAWTEGIRRAADYLAGFMDIRVAYVNYCATTAYALATASYVLGNFDYFAPARELAHFCISQINDDGLLEGEGEWNGVTKTGIDIGYNMEMSLWGLLGYASVTGDREVELEVQRSAEAHRPFVYPDGWLDCSAGLRSCKWTLFGSSTADGALPLYAMMSCGNPSWKTAMWESLRALDRCISSSGLLAPGPDYDVMFKDSPCLYHSCARAKSIALAHDRTDAISFFSLGGTPVEASDTLVFYKTLNTVVVRRGPVKATICAYGYKSPKGAASRFMHRPSGGAVTMLWKAGCGVLQASSPNLYSRWEDSFPELAFFPRPLTSRLELVREGVTYSNLYEYDAVLEIPDQAHVNARGHLKNAEGEDSGVLYEIRYTFDGTGLVKEYSVSGADVDVIEPVLDPGGDLKSYFPSVCCRENRYELENSGTLTLRY